MLVSPLMLVKHLTQCQLTPAKDAGQHSQFRVMLTCPVAKSLGLIEGSQSTSLYPLMYFYIGVISNMF